MIPDGLTKMLKGDDAFRVINAAQMSQPSVLCAINTHSSRLFKRANLWYLLLQHSGYSIPLSG